MTDRSVGIFIWRVANMWHIKTSKFFFVFSRHLITQRTRLIRVFCLSNLDTQIQVFCLSNLDTQIQMHSIAVYLGVDARQLQNNVKSTFAIFTERGFEQVRNGIARPNIVVHICGSHGGIHTGTDGSSAQSIEDLAIYRTLPNMTVIHPCDDLST